MSLPLPPLCLYFAVKKDVIRYPLISATRASFCTACIVCHYVCFVATIANTVDNTQLAIPPLFFACTQIPLAIPPHTITNMYVSLTYVPSISIRASRFFGTYRTYEHFPPHGVSGYRYYIFFVIYIVYSIYSVLCIYILNI